MRFMLKDGWFYYFISGIAAGVFSLLALPYLQSPRTLVVEELVAMIILVLLSSINFIGGCSVREKL